MSLVELLIGAGIMAVIMSAMASYLVAQQKEMSHLARKSEALELKMLMITALQNSAVCTWQFANKVLNLTNVTQTFKSPSSATVSKLHMGLDATTATLAEVNKPLSNYSLIKVSSIALTDIYSTGVPGEYHGELRVSFTNDSGVRPLAPVSVKQIINIETGDPIGAARIKACGAKPPNVSLPVLIEQKPHTNSDSICKILEKPGFVTVSGPMIVRLTIGGVLIGTSVANSGKELGTYNTASISGLAPAGVLVCGTAERAGTFFPFHASGLRMTVSYLQ